jgi:transcriptional regulator with XRE-family HTH domain
MNTKIKEAFGYALKDIRIKNGLSQEELAEISDLHRTYISDCERGVRNASLVNIYKICKSLGIEMSCFFVKMEEILKSEEKDEG